jgi:hypothetical protein|tara:strand:- start:2448 stop:5300 length:2853 start_codon:yes stop_codon:yes gene_type:complete
MYKNYLKTYQDQGEVKLTFDQWCTQKGGGLCESDIAKAQEAYEQYSNDFDISSVQFNRNNPDQDIDSVNFNQTIRDEEELLNQGPIINQQNLNLIKSMGNPYYLGMGDNPFLDLAGAIYDSVQYWKEKDLSKQRPPYPVDPTGKFIINAELQEKYPNSPTKFFQTPDEYDEWLIQRELDYRAEMYPELYQKEKVDLEEYRKTGKRDFKKKRQTMKLGDRLEMFEYPDAQYINYDEDGTPISYFKEVDGEMQEFPISLKGITEPIEIESAPLDSNFRFPVDTDFELQPPAPYDMAAFYGNPRFDIVAENAGIESDFSSYDDDELLEERFGGGLSMYQDGDEVDDVFEDVDLEIDEDIYDDPFENANPEDLDDEGLFIIEEEPEEEEEIEYYTPPEEEDPEDDMFDGTTDDIELERDGDALYTVGTEEGDADFDRMTREDKRAIRRANRSGFGEKVLNTLDKIGTTAVNIAKPITRYLRQRQERKRRRRMGLGYLSDNVFMPTDADLSGSKGDYDPNTGIFRPDDKVISRLGRYGVELPQADIGTEFVANRYPGFDDLTADEQNQVLNQYNVGNNRSFGDDYSDQYLDTMAYKDENRTVGYNPAISELPDWLKTPNEGFGRIIVDDEMARYMKGQVASGNLDPNVVEGYYRFLEGYRGPAAIDYNIDKYNRYQSFDDEKKEKYKFLGSGFGYKDDLPGRGPWNTVYGNYDADMIESLLALSDRVNVSRYPNLDQEAIDAENERDFNRMVSREAYNIKKEERAEADEYFKNLRLKEIEEEPEEEEDINIFTPTNEQSPTRSTATPFMLDEITLTGQRPPVESVMLDEVVLTDAAPPSTTLQPRKVTSVTPNMPSNTIPIIERGTTQANLSNISNQDTSEGNVETDATEYIPQSQREQKEYVPQSQRDDEEYTPQTQEGKALYGGTFFGTGGEAEIDINTYKALIAAGADIEIL